MKKNQKITLGIVLMLITLSFGYVLYQTFATNNDSDKYTPPTPSVEITTSSIRVITPQPSTLITSPLTIRGEARGTWFFEASFPIELVDAAGRIITTTIAQAQGNWMTEDFVPFEATLRFDVTTTTPGELIFKKDNPSGLPQNEAELRIPVVLQPSTTSSRTIQLFYYDPNKDKDTEGNILCSKKGLVAVSRTIPRTNTPIQDVIRLLLRGDLTNQEAARGIATEYPLPGFELKNAALVNNILTLTFDDPQGHAGGGACRAGLLWLQIEQTALQFPEVKKVEFRPEELFQP